MGTNSLVAHWQSSTLQCGAGLLARSKLLWCLFWFPTWATMGVACFYVHTGLLRLIPRVDLLFLRLGKLAAGQLWNSMTVGGIG